MELLTVYHWSPGYNRNSIEAEGLLPSMPPCVNVNQAQHICFCLSAAKAWSLSGDQGVHLGLWDLWECRLYDDVDSLEFMFDWPEVREIRYHGKSPVKAVYVGSRRP